MTKWEANDRKERHASSSSLVARPAVARYGISRHPTASDVDVCVGKSSRHVTQARMGGACKSCSRVLVLHLKEKWTGLEAMGTVRYDTFGVCDLTLPARASEP